MDSPYLTCQAVSVEREVGKGERRRKYNPSRWSDVTLNFTGDTWYKPNLTWVYKRSEKECVAEDLFVYVDDGRNTGTTKEDCWEASRRWGSVCTYMGIK